MSCLLLSFQVSAFSFQKKFFYQLTANSYQLPAQFVELGFLVDGTHEHFAD